MRFPIVLDPVGCHAGAYRLSVVLDLIKTDAISLLRGNQSEVKAIMMLLIQIIRLILPLLVRA